MESESHYKMPSVTKNFLSGHFLNGSHIYNVILIAKPENRDTKIGKYLTVMHFHEYFHIRNNQEICTHTSKNQRLKIMYSIGNSNSDERNEL